VGQADEGVSIAVRGEFGDEHVGVVTEVIAGLPGGEPDLGAVVLDLRGARRCSRRALDLVARLLDDGVRLARDPITWARPRVASLEPAVRHATGVSVDAAASR
jgi:hypothetical protein